MNGADRRMETRDPNESGSSPSASENYDGIGPKRYSYNELATVTGHFSGNNEIGKGGFGHVYKALLDGEICAIKKLNSPNKESEGDLESEIMILKSVSHRNLVELVGYCINGADRLLILKYFSNGSLRSKLHGKEHILDWKKRMNIAIGSARGLEYLHEHCNPKIIHLDIKPDNILLDEDFEPEISDFGLAQFFTDGVTHISKSSVMRTNIYEDPLTTKMKKYSDKSDIYSFGITLLELITGRKSIDNGTDIVTWANRRIKKALEGRYINFVDSTLQSFDQEQMYRMVSCVNSCLNQVPNSRPTMEKIRLVLEGKSPPEELYDHELQWNIIHKDDESSSNFEEDDQIEESSSYFEEDDQIEESSSLYEKNYMSIFEPKPNSFDELVLANYKGGAKPYSYFELAKATDYFSLNNLLDQGGFGEVFIASLDSKILAVKKLYHYVQSEVDFAWEIMVLNGIRHKNLVKLVGYCIDGANRLLISKYFPNKSLRYQLHGNENVLDWKKRINIAIGSARGLQYLHEYSIIHLYIKSDNILLDNDFEAKISDFGRVLSFRDAKTHLFRSSTFGTHVYADPLSVKLEEYSNKFDIYSFGVILLELITGKKLMIDENLDIVTWAQPLIKKALEREYMDFVDPRLQFFDDQEMHRMIFCVDACINQPLRFRPSMKMILLALEGTLPPENLRIEKNDNELRSRASYKEADEPKPIPKPPIIPETNRSSNQVYRPRRFTSQQLSSATRDFSESNLLYRGIMGEVYVASLNNFGQVIIKKFRLEKEDEFRKIKRISSSVHHDNLVNMVGYCDERNNKLLVYECLRFRSLRFRLLGTKTMSTSIMEWSTNRGIALSMSTSIMEWPTIRGIALSIAKRLVHLHELYKPLNIYEHYLDDCIFLDDNLEPKFAEYGCTNFFLKDSEMLLSNSSPTSTYLKLDVYFLGIILLKLISGKQQHNDISSINEYNLIELMAIHLKNNWPKNDYSFVDTRIESYDKHEMDQMIECAIACVNPCPQYRPQMSQVVEVLAGNIPARNLEKNFFFFHEKKE